MFAMEKLTIFDGGLGTELEQRGLKLGESPEEANIMYPLMVSSIHEDYVASGADYITTNTFGANRFKLKNSKYSLKDIIISAIANAKKANPKCLMFDIGPLGQMLEPIGNLSFDDAYEAFKEIVLIANESVDGFILETFTDIYELKCAVLAVKENSNKPVFATMSFDENKRSLTGTTPEIMANILDGLGVDVIGANCSLGPNEMIDIVKEILDNTNTPVIVQPNRGLPTMKNGKAIYEMSVEAFCVLTKKFVDMGVAIIGGCCGTNPEVIKGLCKYKGLTVPKRNVFKQTFVCSANKKVVIDGVKIIGERLNPTGKKKLKEALINDDYSYILNEAIKQEEAGAHILDVNVGIPKIDEEKKMVDLIKKIAEVSTIPLQIDSSNSVVIERACRYYNGIPLINSVNGSYEVMDKIFPIAKKYGAMIIGLALDENGVPKTALERFEIAKRIIDHAKTYGISKDRIVIDTLVLTVSAEQKLVMETIKALKMVTEDLGVKTALGVSNVSFGLPNRPLLNRTFLTMAMNNGLNLPIINPGDVAMLDAIKAFNVLSAYDLNSETFIESYNDVVTEKPASDLSLAYVIKKGIVHEAKSAVLKELEHKEPMEVINGVLIPSLNEVGALFDKGTLFLPQLLQSANATKEAFEVITSKFPSKEAKKGPIILLTVKGDVHDIGKNIVKVILESYGYYVIDLGKDVPKEKVIEAFNKYKPRAIGLSALMTTTVVSMEETISELKNIKGMCPILVGGAVLNNEIAKEINADYYTKDALECVTLLEKIL